jgi:hypothetical protein
MLAHCTRMLMITLFTLVGLITPGSKTAPCGKHIAIIWLVVAAHKATANF